MSRNKKTNLQNLQPARSADNKRVREVWEKVLHKASVASFHSGSCAERVPGDKDRYKHRGVLGSQERDWEVRVFPQREACSQSTYNE